MKRLASIIAFILLGSYALIAQVIFIREFLVVFYGSELCLGIIFGNWLFGISLGAWASSKIVDRCKEQLNIFIILQLLMVILLPFQIYFIRMVRVLLRISPGEFIALLPMVVASLLIILTFSLLVGAIFPFACKLYITSESTAAISIGRVYVLEAIGSIIGGLAITFCLIPHFSSFQIIILFSLLVLAHSFLLTIINPKNFTRRILGCFLLLFLLLYGHLFLFEEERIDRFLTQRRWQGLNNGTELIISRDSEFQNIAIGKIGTQYSIFGNGQYITSFPDKYRSAGQAHFFLCQHPLPRKVLLIGGGIEGMIREILKYPISELDYIELDPQLIQVASPYLPVEDKKALSDDKVRIYYGDGRHFVKKSKKKYDLIILNLPDPSTALINRFYTVDFFKQAKRIMNPRGVLITGVSSAVNYIGEEVGNFSSSIYRSLKAVFPYLLVTPGETNYFFATSSAHIISQNPDILAERFLKHQIKSEYFSLHHFKIFLPQDRIKFIKQALQKGQDLSLNTDLKPVSYFFHLILWEIFSQKTSTPSIFQWLSKINLYWLILPLIIFLLIRTGYIFKHPEKLEDQIIFNCLFAIFTTGFASMALEIILIFSFQSIYGYLYQKVGLIIALFMAGLALGGYIMNRILLRRIKRSIPVLLGIEIGISAYSFFLPFFLSILFFWSYREDLFTFNPEYIFISLVLVAGILTGLEFPLASNLLLQNKKAGAAAGVVDSFDHLGAFLGAFLAGTILVPLLGIKESCFLVGIINLLSVILLSANLIQKRGIKGGVLYRKTTHKI